MEIVVNVNGDPDLTAVVGGELSFFNPETDEYETRGRTLGDLVAGKLADRLIARAGEMGSMHDTLKAVRETRENIIRERLAPLIEKALTAEIFPTNQYGERIGSEVITLRELAVKEAVKAVTTSGGRYDRKPSLLESVVAQEISKMMTKELNETIGAAKAEVIKAVRAKAAEYLTTEIVGRKL